MILTTDRLRLRPSQIADFPAYAEFLTTPRSQGVGGPLDTKAAGTAAVVRDGARGLPTLVCDVGVANATPHGLAALQASPVAPARGHLQPSRRRSCHD